MDRQQTEAAWAAGFFDGEGCSGYYRKSATGGALFRMSINQRQREPLERFRAAIGGLGTIGSYEAGGKPMFGWKLQSFEACEQAMDVLWPYLCSIKRAQYEQKADEFIAAWNARNHSGKGYQFMTNEERAAYQREWRRRNLGRQAAYQRNYRAKQKALLAGDHATELSREKRGPQSR